MRVQAASVGGLDLDDIVVGEGQTFPEGAVTFAGRGKFRELSRQPGGLPVLQRAIKGGNPDVSEE